VEVLPFLLSVAPTSLPSEGESGGVFIIFLYNLEVGKTSFGEKDPTPVENFVFCYLRGPKPLKLKKGGAFLFRGARTIKRKRSAGAFFT